MQTVPHIDWLPERRSITYSSATLRLIDAVAKQARTSSTTMHPRSSRSGVRPTRPSRHTRTTRQTAPDWMGETRRKAVASVREWAAQAWMLTQTPQRFASAWATGKREALNPVHFLAVGSLVAVLCERAGRWLIGLPSQHGVAGWLSGSLGQMVNVVALGALMHVVLRRWSKSQFGISLGAVLFAIGGPGVLCMIPGWAATILLHLRGAAVPQFTTHTGVTLPVPVLAASVFGLAWMLATTAAVHGLRWWRSLVAFAASLATMAVFCGLTAYAARLLS